MSQDAKALVKELVDSGIHFGHRTSNWHPKMKPYIYGKKNGIHILDVRETVKGLLLAKKFVTKVVGSGKDVLFVGTKRQARPALEQFCSEAEQPYVIERWLGGTLTNFSTIRSRLKRLEELESLMAGEEWAHYSKKMASQLGRERRKIDRNLGGIRTMDRLPGAVFVIDVQREHNALMEAKKLGIPTIALLDTDSNPGEVDLPIPGNDDAMRSIELVVKELMAAVEEGKSARAASREGVDVEEAGDQPKRRRSRRSRFSASADGSATDAVIDSDAPEADSVVDAPVNAEAAPEAPAEEGPVNPEA